MLQKCLLLLLLIYHQTSYSENTKFQIIVLGSGGGPFENNLSGYLLAPIDSNDFIALDAGTLLSGINLAVDKKSFLNIIPTEELTLTGEVFLNRIKAYLISHAHLDHVSGLIIASQSDSKKPIMALPRTIDFIKDYLFNWKIWPNFANEGIEPFLNVYSYVRLKVNEKIDIPLTKMSVRAFPLSHPNGYLSTAFLIESDDQYILYFGDTSPDNLEKKKDLFHAFEMIAPLIRDKKLHGIFLESSYTDHQHNNQLFGHLDAKFLIDELHELAKLVDSSNSQHALKNLKVFVTHIKESFNANQSNQSIIFEEIQKLNDLGVEFIFPKQGERYEI